VLATFSARGQEPILRLVSRHKGKTKEPEMRVFEEHLENPDARVKEAGNGL
jgi:hypothetical protein